MTPRLAQFLARPVTDYPDGSIGALLREIRDAILSVEKNQRGPYGALEWIASEIEDFLDESKP
jgi:hypothetical protein